MRVSEYAGYDATGLADLVRRGELSRRDVYRAAFEAILLVNRELNAVADGPWEVPPRYQRDGAFAGVPFVVEDLGGHLAGSRVRCGSRIAGAGVRPAVGTFLGARFRAMGLAFAGLATTPEVGFGTTSEATVYGATHNPWDVRRSCGGASGGTAALVAAGAVPAGHGSDGAGSIRIGAACNGLVGLKPSRGRTSGAPGAQESIFGLSTNFALTRTLRDCAALLRGVAAPAPGDKYMIEGSHDSWTYDVATRPGCLRVAVHTSSWSDVEVDEQVARSVEHVGRRLQELGHEVEYATPPVDWDEFVTTEADMLAVSNAEVIDALAEASGLVPGPETLERATLLSYRRGHQLKAVDLARAFATVSAVSRRVGRFFDRWDLLVTPTLNVAPLALGYLDADERGYDCEAWVRRAFGWCSFVPLFSWTGTPALSLPLGATTAGVPIGVQLAAPMCDERTLFRVGSQLEEAMPWGRRHPRIHAAAARAHSHV